MSDDYAKGFKDGFAAGLEEGKRHQNLNPVPYTRPYEPLDMTKDNCPKCGIKISGVMGYVCTSINCPTFPQVTCCAVGATYDNMSSSYPDWAGNPTIAQSEK